MSQPAQRRIVADYFRALPPGRLLDLPCGRMWLAHELGGLGFDYHGADLLAPNDPPPASTFHHVDLDQVLPFDTASFDYIACVEGLEHSESVHRVLAELGRLLRPGGRLLITTPNVLTVKSRIRYLLRGRYYGFPHLTDDVARGAHAHLSWAPLPLVDFAARRAGLRRDRVLPYPIRPSDRLYWPLAAIYLAADRIEAAVASTRPARRALLAELATPHLLLGETLVVSFSKPAS